MYIYAGEDLPNGESLPKTSEQPKLTPIQTQRVITPAQLNYLRRLIREARSTEENVKDFFSLDRLEDLAMKDFDRALASLRKAA